MTYMRRICSSCSHRTIWGKMQVRGEAFPTATASLTAGTVSSAAISLSSRKMLQKRTGCATAPRPNGSSRTFPRRGTPCVGSSMPRLGPSCSGRLRPSGWAGGQAMTTLYPSACLFFASSPLSPCSGASDGCFVQVSN